MVSKIIRVSGLQGGIKVRVNIVTYTPCTFMYSSIKNISYTGSTSSGNPIATIPKFIGMSNELVNYYNGLGIIFYKHANNKLKYNILVEWFNEPELGQILCIDKFEFFFDEDNKGHSNLRNPINPNFGFKFK